MWNIAICIVFSVSWYVVYHKVMANTQPYWKVRTPMKKFRSNCLFTVLNYCTGLTCTCILSNRHQKYIKLTKILKSVNLKDHTTLLLTFHHLQWLPWCSTNVKIQPCAYFSRCQAAFLKPICCHSCWNRVYKHYRTCESC